MKANWLRNPLLFSLTLIASLGFIYGHQFNEDSFLAYDDSFVIGAMSEVRSLSEYRHAFLAAKVSDVQPVRDLVSWMDYSLLNWFQISAFHLTNVLIWLATLLGLRKLIFFAEEKYQNVLLGTLLILAVNPLYVTAVSWLSARKHLLAANFAVWATFCFLKWRKENFRNRSCYVGMVGFYLLAVFSQPIILLWPVFILVLLVLGGETKNWKKLIPLFCIMLLAYILNSLYYASEMYMKLSFSTPKISDFYNRIASLRLFLLGRYLFQALVPYWTSVAIYDFKSWRGFTGIFLFPVSFYFFWKTLSKPKVIAAFAFFILMLAPVVLRMTQIFGTDTYLLTASFAIYFLMAETFGDWFKNHQKILSGIMLVTFFAFAMLSRERALGWDNDLDVFGQAWKIEGNRDAGERYLNELMHRQREKEAVWYAIDLLERFPTNASAQGIIVNSIANDPDLTTEQKIDKIYNLHFFSPFSLDILAKLEFTLKNYKSSEQLMLDVLKQEEWRMVLIGLQENFAARIFTSCTLAKDTACEEKARLVQKQTALHWDEAKFEAEKKKLSN